jgi:hypothetical protein
LAASIQGFIANFLILWSLKFVLGKKSGQFLNIQLANSHLSLKLNETPHQDEKCLFQQNRISFSSQNGYLNCAPTNEDPNF